MHPERPGRTSSKLVIAVVLPLALLIAASSAIIPRAYLPIVMNPAPTPTSDSMPTVTPGPSPTPPVSGIPPFSHIFTIIFENHEYNEIIGNPAAPYFNTLAQQYGLATNYYALRHPSLPNYIALTAGSPFTITGDCRTCFLNVPTIADQIEHVGKTWRAYMEGLPSPCFLGNAGAYAQRHNPFIYYDAIRLNPTRCANIVPFTQFATDLQQHTLPNYAWITPDTCHDMHDCAIAVGDAWLKTVVPQILASSAWQQNGVLFILFDEGSTNAGCCSNAIGGKVATIVISPLGKPAYQSVVPYTHYSLLRTIEDAWGLPELEHAACACAPPMTDFFTVAAQPPGR
jgi:hypothetical protein